MKLRTGRKVGRTLYVQLGDEPSDLDPFVGALDSLELAAFVVTAVNQLLGSVPVLQGHFDEDVARTLVDREAV